jgi:hypothetical protein
MKKRDVLYPNCSITTTISFFRIKESYTERLQSPLKMAWINEGLLLMTKYQETQEVKIQTNTVPITCRSELYHAL